MVVHVNIKTVHKCSAFLPVTDSRDDRAVGFQKSSLKASDEIHLSFMDFFQSA